MTTPITKTEFLQRFDEAQAAWQAAVWQIKLEEMTSLALHNGWSVKDLIAHISWFEKEMIILLRDMTLAGSPHWQNHPDKRNALIYEENKDRPPAEVLGTAPVIAAQFRAAFAALDEAALYDATFFRDMPSDWVPAQLFAENSFEHYEAHLAELKAIIQSRVGQ